MAGFWAAKLETDHVKDQTFQTNFFRDFKAVLKDFPPVCLHADGNDSDVQADIAERRDQGGKAVKVRL